MYVFFRDLHLLRYMLLVQYLSVWPQFLATLIVFENQLLQLGLAMKVLELRVIEFL